MGGSVSDGWRVFVSHTSELRRFPASGSYVAAAERAVTAAGHAVVDMADFPSVDLPPAELCVERVRSCDVYVGVLGVRYGSLVRSRPEVSYTELEFDTATAAGLDRLIFLLDIEADHPGVPVWALTDNEFGARQVAFRKRVGDAGVTAQQFGSPAHLGQLVERSLRELADRRGGVAVVPVDGVDNLPMGSAVFEGRDLARLAGLLDGAGGAVVGQAAVYGLGGIGKTELAIHYARNYRDRYGLVWWVTADTAENVALGLAALAGRLRPADTLADAQAWALSWLQTHRGWLLVLDNVEDLADIEPLLGQVAGRGHVVVTTRRELGTARWARLGLAPLRLEVLDRAASVQLLHRLTGLDDAGGAGRLAAALGDLPLALEQAAAYVSQHDGLSFGDYLQLLADRFGLVAAALGEGSSAQRTVATIWQASMDAVAARSALAVRVLQVLAWLGPDALPEDALLPLADDPVAVGEALAVLASFSLVNRGGGQASVHRLVQAVVRQNHPQSAGEDVTTTATGVQAAVAVIRTAIPDDPRANVVGWQRWNQLLPHIDALTEHAGPQHTSTDLMFVNDRAATYRQFQGQLSAAVGLFE
ncbi:DUF4062 domain-containing protein, partial [Paractinoplanes rishiriensis]|uniref:DUF4062 domain-containing protein n=1 Tax=Paractinoplanes rishiriensis TaxID=1050105 RepID=UPI0023B25A4B